MTSRQPQEWKDIGSYEEEREETEEQSEFCELKGGGHWNNME